jgi:hypothetical protein
VLTYAALLQHLSCSGEARLLPCSSTGGCSKASTAGSGSSSRDFKAALRRLYLPQAGGSSGSAAALSFSCPGRPGAQQQQQQPAARQQHQVLHLLLRLYSHFRELPSVSSEAAAAVAHLAASAPAPSARLALAPVLASDMLLRLLHARQQRLQRLGLQLLQALLESPLVLAAAEQAVAGPQQQRAAAAAAGASAAAAAAAGGGGGGRQGGLEAHVVQELLTALLDCLSAELAPEPEESPSSPGCAEGTAAPPSQTLAFLQTQLPAAPTQQQAQQQQPLVLQRHPAPGVPTVWGCLELQRRALAAVALLLSSGCPALLTSLHDTAAVTGGCGLAQRLLELADSAASAPGGDPLLPVQPGEGCSPESWAERVGGPPLLPARTQAGPPAPALPCHALPPLPPWLQSLRRRGLWRPAAQHGGGLHNMLVSDTAGPP